MGLSVMLILLGIAAVISALNPVRYATSTLQLPLIPRFGWIGSLIGSLIGLFILFFFLSWIFSWPWSSRRYRTYGLPWGDSAVHIIRERYAKGEIAKEQFEQMMRDLEEHH